MRLTEKLLRFIYSALNKAPEEFVAFRVRSAVGEFSYSIADYRIVCRVDGVQVFSANLGDHTLLSLAQALGSLTGCSIVYRADPETMSVSARVLLDGARSQSQSNGDCLYAYSSLLWVYLESVSVELSAANDAVSAMIDQLSLKSADGYWLEYWGEHFGVRRKDGEDDAAYSQRIVVEVLRPRGNNKAIEVALFERFGQVATVVDAPRRRSQTNLFNGFNSFNGVKLYDATDDVYYGLFDVVVGYNLEGGASPNAFAADVRAFVERFRDAGTHLQSLLLSSSSLEDAYQLSATESLSASLSLPLTDSFAAPADSSYSFSGAFGMFTDSFQGGSDSASASIAYATAYDSLRTFNGVAKFNSGLTLAESL